MAKTKPQTNGKPVKSTSSTKDAGVTKPLQKPAKKAEKLAKTTASKVLPTKKDSKKSKKSKKEESSSDESEASDSGASSDADSSEDDSETEVSNVSAPKANGVKKTVPVSADSSEDEEDSEDDSDQSEAEVPAPKSVPAKAAKVNGTAKPAAKADSDDSEDDDESGSDAAETSDESDSSADEAPAKTKGAKAAATKVNGAAKDEDDSEEDSSDDSEEDSEEEAEAPSKKRKADAVSTPVAKKSKTEVTTPSGAEGVKNLFVGGLSWNIDEEWLAREFEEFGEIAGARIITDKESGRSKGFGYVEFVDADSAANALNARHESILDGRTIRVDFSTPRQPRDETTPRDRANSRANKFGDSTANPTDTLFCGNLSFDCTNDAVSEAFAEFGSITSVRLPTDRETGAPKGFGYISFSTVEEAKSALETMNGEEIAGRRCRLDYAQPRDQNGGGGGRGGFGDRGGRGGRGRGGFGDRGGRGGRGRGGFGDRGGRGGSRGGFTTNRGGFGDFKGNKVSFD